MADHLFISHRRLTKDGATRNFGRNLSYEVLPVQRSICQIEWIFYFLSNKSICTPNTLRMRKNVKPIAHYSNEIDCSTIAVASKDETDERRYGIAIELNLFVFLNFLC